jgi:hypothetical protein
MDLNDPLEFQKKISINFAISDLIDYSIKEVEGGNMNVLGESPKRIKKEFQQEGTKGNT